MADNLQVTAGSGSTLAADEVADGTLGTVKVGYVKLMDGTLDGTSKAAVGANGLAADVKASVLPTGASTAAKQPALGTAGAASADVITVQGVTSMTPLKTDGSGVTQPVSLTSTTLTGTVAATQSGTWTVQPGNTANTTAWKVDGSAVTQPVSGTVTANAGTNLNTSALALDASVTGLQVAQGSTTSGQKGGVALGAVTTAAPTYTTAQSSPLSLDTTGALRVNVTAGGAGGGAVTVADGADVTLGAKADAKSTATDTTAISAMSVLKQISASVQAPPSQAVTNTGTFAAQAAQSGTWTVQPGNTANTTAWKVDGSAVTQPVSGTVTANMGTVTADPFGANADAASATGSISAKLRFIAGTGIPVTGTVTVGSHAVTNAGTFAVQAATAGDVAHDGVDSGNPVKVGYKAIAHGTNPTAVSAADRTDSYANRAGIPFVMGGHPNIVTIEAAYTSAQTDAAIVTIGAGLKIVVTQIQATCDNANTVNVALRVGFGTANTPTTTGVVLTHPGIAAGSGVSRGDGSGMLGVGADNEDLRVTSGVPTTGSLRVLVSYYTIES